MIDFPCISAVSYTHLDVYKRQELEKDGFTMYQYSIYIRYCGSQESANVHIKRVKSILTPSGKVSILTVTDKQYSKIINMWGEIKQKLKKMCIRDSNSHRDWNCRACPSPL